MEQSFFYDYFNMPFGGLDFKHMLLKKSFIRGIIPFVIMTTLSIIMNYQGIDAFQVRSTFIVGLIITVVAAASVIYENDKWSIRKQTVVHFLIMLITVLPCLLVSGWFESNNPLDYLKVFGYFLLTGVVIFSVMYFLFTKIVNRKNPLIIRGEKSEGYEALLLIQHDIYRTTVSQMENE